MLLESAPGRANVVARIAGTDPGAAALLVHGHLDVVPAEPADWKVHPFSGEVRDGVVWGRGAVDMKNMDAMVLAVVRSWASGPGAGRRATSCSRSPRTRRTATEYGSSWLADHAGRPVRRLHRRASANQVPSRSTPGLVCACIPSRPAERGTAWLKLTAHGRAGHGSKPNPANAVVRLGEAVARLGAYRWPVRLIPTVRAAIAAIADAVGAEVDLDAEHADVDELLAQLGPAAHLVEATVRNSANPTMLEAGYKINVIPARGRGLRGRAAAARR